MIGGRSVTVTGLVSTYMLAGNIRRQGMRAIIAFFVLVFFISTARGQHPHGNGTTKVVEPHPGLGNYHHPITTKSAEAQTYFDQGLTLLYGFNHDEAARYFQR